MLLKPNTSLILGALHIHALCFTKVSMGLTCVVLQESQSRGAPWCLRYQIWFNTIFNLSYMSVTDGFIFFSWNYKYISKIAHIIFEKQTCSRLVNQIVYCFNGCFPLSSFINSCKNSRTNVSGKDGARWDSQLESSDPGYCTVGSTAEVP